MNDLMLTIATLLSLGSLAGMLLLFVFVMRAIARRERNEVAAAISQGDRYE